MLNLRPGQPKTKKGKKAPPPAPPKRKPASLRSSKKTLAQQLNIRPDVSKDADNLERAEKKKKESEAMPTKLLPVPKAVQITGDDALRDLYLEQHGIKKETIKGTADTPAKDKLAQEQAAVLQNIEPPLDQTIPKTTNSLMDRLKSFR